MQVLMLSQRHVEEASTNYLVRQLRIGELPHRNALGHLGD